MSTINATNGIISAKVIKHGTDYADSATRRVLLAVATEEDEFGIVGGDQLGWVTFAKAKTPALQTTLNVPCKGIKRTMSQWTNADGEAMESPFFEFQK